MVRADAVTNTCGDGTCAGSELCGPDDILAPIAPDDEAQRAAHGHGARNYRIPFNRYRAHDIARLIARRRAQTARSMARQTTHVARMAVVAG